jgi:hypothetical protein
MLRQSSDRLEPRFSRRCGRNHALSGHGTLSIDSRKQPRTPRSLQTLLGTCARCGLGVGSTIGIGVSPRATGSRIVSIGSGAHAGVLAPGIAHVYSKWHVKQGILERLYRIRFDAACASVSRAGWCSQHSSTRQRIEATRILGRRQIMLDGQGCHPSCAQIRPGSLADNHTSGVLVSSSIGTPRGANGG